MTTLDEPDLPFTFEYPGGCEVARSEPTIDDSWIEEPLYRAVEISSEIADYLLTIRRSDKTPIIDMGPPEGFVRRKRKILSSPQGDITAETFQATPLPWTLFIRWIARPMAAGGVIVVVLGLGLLSKLLGTNLWITMLLGFLAVGWAFFNTVRKLRHKSNPYFGCFFVYSHVLFAIYGKKSSVLDFLNRLVFRPLEAETNSRAFTDQPFK